MEILVKEQPPRSPEVAVLIGLGMIGSAVRDGLERLQFRSTHRIPMDWHDAEECTRAGDLVRLVCYGLAPAPSQISIAWSAGRANFFSTDDDTAAENRSFADVLGLAADLKRSLGATKVEFHFLSSAGGLFEGQRVVDRTSVPSPRRAYGRMKQSQESQLRNTLDPGEIRIYRPSSVYGPMIQPRKHGLINHLITNAANRRTTTLDANLMALRDYVYAGDVGAYLARQIAFRDREANSEQVHFLVSGRCASIFEVVARIERVMNLRIRYRLDEEFGNNADITFAGDVLPPGWRPSTLDVGIRQFLLKDRPQTRALSDAAIG